MNSLEVWSWLAMSQIWVVEDGTVNKYDGSFEDYKDELMSEITKEVEEFFLEWAGFFSGNPMYY